MRYLIVFKDIINFIIFKYKNEAFTSSITDFFKLHTFHFFKLGKILTYNVN